ncbi:ribokinase [Candidatus Epulonipiscium viviparus]|uniref:ribokinase n=1 Tax=Candidatus Epulonipiscium viviparus TaxID=420336 RepID=UPI00016C09F2|nr:ribokinase [Candidatus Epulopiscium viviparus]
MARILNFGSLNIDYVYSVDDFTKPGETINSTQLEIFCGGKGLNQSIALSRAGADVYHAGIIGAKGAMLLDALTAANVNVDLISQLNIPDGHAIIQLNKQGENCIVVHAGSNKCISNYKVEDVFQHFGLGDILVIQNEINNLAYIMQLAHQKKMKIVFNPSPIDDSICQLPLKYVDYLILNQLEAMKILSTEDDSNLLNRLSNMLPNAHIVLTLGAQGSKYKYQNTEYEQDIFAVDVVDTTAAGDTFLGYFVASIAREDSAQAALEIAAKAASIAITTKGAAQSIPTLDAIF